MYENDEFYEDYGRVSCAFSAMEFEIHEFLIGLCFENDFVKAAPFLDKNTLGTNIQLLENVSVSHRQLGEFTTLVKSLKALVADRNQFVHGLWNPHTYESTSGHAGLKNKKIQTEKFSNGGVQWTNGSSRSINKDHFNKTLKEIRHCIRLIETLKTTLEADECEDYDFSNSNNRDHLYQRLFIELI